MPFFIAFSDLKYFSFLQKIKKKSNPSENPLSKFLYCKSVKLKEAKED